MKSASYKNIQQLDLNLLKVFHTLYVEQNMTRTADILHITPSAVSHAIKRLRLSLDDPLFHRSQNKMLPTPACKQMAPPIIEALTRLQQSLQQWGDFDPSISEHNFRIGMHESIEPSVVPRLSAYLSKVAPNINFTSIKFNRSNVQKELASGNIDTALDAAFAVKSPIKSQFLVESEFVVLMNHMHPLKDKLTKESYLKAKHIVVSSRSSGMSIEDMSLQKLGIDRQITIRCQNHLAATLVVQQSDQLLSVSKFVAEQFTGNKLITRALPFPIPALKTHLYWHENTDKDAALTWLRQSFYELTRAG